MATDLITLAEYKSYMNKVNPSDDAMITALIPKVSDLIKRICGRTFIDYVNDDKVEVFRGGFNNYLVQESPLLSVNSVEYSTDYGQTYTALTEFTDYVSVLDEDRIEFISAQYDENSPPQVNKFRITYNGGFTSVPDDIKLAAFDLVTYYMRNDGAVHSQKPPGSNTIQIDYITNNRLPAHISRVLDLYRSTY
ncbi:gp6 domain containing protein [uncultured Caudovirales phage]|uniref:Gp6 domain containing protein n=1 Tax=uncultured Caudovirales phage TaxID=2100421 RepID=A0A6J5LS23_9CAUD|nr:gp6 domain containing protein [uncultured Caudovirales phage]